jgi:type I restriction enzyme, S subunit
MGTLNSEPKEYIGQSDFDEWMTRGLPQKGDVLFTTEAPLGNTAILDTDEKRAFAQRLITFQPKKEVYISKFLFYYLLSPVFHEELASKATGTTVKGIKASILKKFQIPLPPPP